MELGVGKLVTRLKLTVVFASFLNRVVGEMNHAVRRIFEIILATTRPQVAILVPVALQVSIIRRRQGEASNIELAIFVQQGLLDVFLDDVTAFVTVDLLGLNQRLDVVQITAHLDAATPVSVFAWLYNPEGATVLGVLLQRLVTLRVVESFNKFLKFTIGLTLTDVKRQRQVVEGILASGFIVNLHVVVNGLLVGQMEVAFLVIGRRHVVTRDVLFLLLLLIIVLLAFSCIRAGPDLVQSLGPT